MPPLTARPRAPEAGLVAVLLFAVLSGCAATPPSAPASFLAPCRLPDVPGLALCGVLPRPEDPARPEGRSIPLRVVLLPADHEPAAADPLVFLAGGPGQAATEVIAAVLPSLAEVRRHRALLFVDQRGTGSSNGLSCPPAVDPTLQEKLSLDAGLEELDACLAALPADPRFYTTDLAMDDLDAVREALGIGQISLYGGSYGTRAGLVYLRRHGEHVRAAILDGLAPPQVVLFATFGLDGSVALARTFADCAAEPACAVAHPDVRARADALFARLAATPAQTTLRDPRTGLPQPVRFERDLVASLVRGSLYLPAMASLLPHAFARAEAGDWQPLLGQGVVFADSAADSIDIGMMLSVACAEDLPRLTDAHRAAAAADPLLGTSLLDLMVATCARWPAAPLPAGAGEPVVSDVPVLLLSGELDPVTPPHWADLAATTLSRSVHVVVPGTGHIAAGAGCVPDLLDEFLQAGTEQGLDLDRDCLRPTRPPFFVSAAGPPP